MKNSEKTFEQLLQEFNDYILNSNRPDLVVNEKQFIEYYDECFVDGIAGIATMHLNTAERNKARKSGVYA
jgi:hypothetical protein